MTMAITFSSQNDTGLCMRTKVLENIVLIVCLIFESKVLYYLGC